MSVPLCVMTSHWYCWRHVASWNTHMCYIMKTFASLFHHNMLIDFIVSLGWYIRLVRNVSLPPSELNKFVIVLCFVVRCFMSILVLGSSWWWWWWGGGGVVALLGLSSWCLVMVEWLFLAVPWVVCGLWLWYFLIILTYHFLVFWQQRNIGRRFCQ